jgi:glucan biosynthesis protein C
MAAALAVAVASFLIRITAPLGEEVWRLSISQAPGWITAFALGVVGEERGWFSPISPRIVTYARRTGITALIAGDVALASTAFGVDVGRLFGGGTWESLVLAAIEGVLVVTMPLWLWTYSTGASPIRVGWYDR